MTDMTKPYDGGPAFPDPARGGGHCMGSGDPMTPHDAAMMAYEVADTMLAVRDGI